MSEWTACDLSRINASDELEIEAVLRDGTHRTPRPIWVVRVGDDLFVRAAYGEKSRWHRAASARDERGIWSPPGPGVSRTGSRSVMPGGGRAPCGRIIVAR